MTQSILATTTLRGNFRQGVHFTQGRQNIPVDRIVLHHSGGLTLSSAINTLISRGLSYHYIINGDEIHSLVSEDNIAYHAGTWAMNQRSIGICVINSTLAPDFKISDRSKASLIKLVAEVTFRRGILLNADGVKSHREVFATNCFIGTDKMEIIREASRLKQQQIFKPMKEEDMKLFQIANRKEIYSLECGKLTHVGSPEELLTLHRTRAGIGRKLSVDVINQREFDLMVQHLNRAGVK